MFLIDILIIFNTGIYNEDYEMMVDRSQIAKAYLKSWFMIDIIAIIPFDLAIQTNATDMVRLSRLGRIYKVIKLLKLMRLIKLSKGKQTNLINNVQEFLRIDMAFKRIFMFSCYFLLTCHIVACCWIITGTYDESEESWIYGMREDPIFEQYLTSFYFTITTVTTVGYGDISASTGLEKGICILIMMIGVMAFSFASGALANYIQQ